MMNNMEPIGKEIHKFFLKKIEEDVTNDPLNVFTRRDYLLISPMFEAWTEEYIQNLSVDAFSNGFGQGLEFGEIEDPAKYKDLLVDFLDSIRDYEREAGHSLADDERESIEFVNTFLTDQDGEIDVKKQNGFVQIIFPENEIPYIQDHGFWKSVPSGVKFIVANVTKQNGLKLVADGYGALHDNKFGLKYNYGNGAIYVSVSDLPEKTQDTLQELEVTTKTD